MKDEKYKRTYNDLKHENGCLFKRWGRLKVSIRKMCMELDKANEEENISIDTYIDRKFLLQDINRIIDEIEREVV